jgi:hypothetical protein
VCSVSLFTYVICNITVPDGFRWYLVFGWGGVKFLWMNLFIFLQYEPLISHTFHKDKIKFSVFPKKFHLQITANMLPSVVIVC